MPNYKMNETVRMHLVEQTLLLLKRYTAYADTGGPLTADLLQKAITPPAVLRHFEALASHGVENLPRGAAITCVLDPEHVPGLLRTCALLVTVQGRTSDTGVYMVKPCCHGAIGVGPTLIHRKWASTCQFDEWDDFTPGFMASLASWANQMVRAHRAVAMIHHTVKQVLDPKCTPTSAHLLALWPLLASVLPQDTCNGDIIEWRRRFRNPPRSLKPYGPANNHLYPPTRFDQLMPRIAAADAILCAAQMLTPLVPDKEAPTVGFLRCEPLDTDVVFI